MGEDGSPRLCLDSHRGPLRLASLHKRQMGLDRPGLDVGFPIPLGLDPLPLRPLGLGFPDGMVLGSGNDLVSSLGGLEALKPLHRLGAASP